MRAADLARHVVESLGQPAYFLAAVAGDLLVVVSLRHLFGRGRDLPQRPRDRARQQAGYDDAGQEGDAAGQEQARQQIAPRLADVALIDTDHRLIPGDSDSARYDEARLR